MTVGAMCKPSAPDGVIVSMGDAMDGFSLYVQDGVPHFAVRTKGTLHEVVATDPINLDQWTHIAGVIGPKGGLSLLVNAWMVAERAEPSFLTRTPAGSFAVGADAGIPSATTRRLATGRVFWRTFDSTGEPSAARRIAICSATGRTAPAAAAESRGADKPPTSAPVRRSMRPSVGCPSGVLGGVAARMTRKGKAICRLRVVRDSKEDRRGEDQS